MRPVAGLRRIMPTTVLLLASDPLPPATMNVLDTWLQ
jgi:hypothetical protein